MFEINQISKDSIVAKPKIWLYASLIWLSFLITSIILGFFWGFNYGVEEGTLASQESYENWITEHERYRRIVEYVFDDLSPEEKAKYLQ